jgi:hypothetical protein
VFRRVIYFLPWLVFFFIEAPGLIPEALAEQKIGAYVNVLARWAAVTGAAYFAYRGRNTEIAPKRKLIYALMTVVGWIAVGLGATLFPRTHLTSCSKGPLKEVDICHQWVMGFSPDIPYYSLAKGSVSEWFCEKQEFKFHDEMRTFAPVDCPSRISGKCFATEWTTPNGSNYWVGVATDEHCARGIFFEGRGRPAKERWERVRGIQ